jgi:hypothetical protein
MTRLACTSALPPARLPAVAGGVSRLEPRVSAGGQQGRCQVPDRRPQAAWPDGLGQDERISMSDRLAFVAW